MIFWWLFQFVLIFFFNPSIAHRIFSNFHAQLICQFKTSHIFYHFFYMFKVFGYIKVFLLILNYYMIIIFYKHSKMSKINYKYSPKQFTNIKNFCSSPCKKSKKLPLLRLQAPYPRSTIYQTLLVFLSLSYYHSLSMLDSHQYLVFYHGLLVVDSYPNLKTFFFLKQISRDDEDNRKRKSKTKQASDKEFTST